MISAISITHQVDQELVTAPRHWGTRVKGFIVDTLGTWRDKILTAAAVYEVVQAVFLILGGYFLAGVISAAMSALLVKSMKELKEFASLDRPISLLQEESYRYGLLNQQHQMNNEDLEKKLAEFQQGIDHLKQENEKLAQSNEKYGLLNAEHGALNAEQRANNAAQQANNYVHNINNVVQQGNNYIHNLNNVMQQGNNYAHYVNNAIQAELNIRNMIMVEQFRQMIGDATADREEARALLYQNYEEYKASIQELSEYMKRAGDEQFASATARMVKEFEAMTQGLIEMNRELNQKDREEIQRGRDSLEKDKKLIEKEKLDLDKKRHELEELREQYWENVMRGVKANTETQGVNNAALSRIVQQMEENEKRREEKMSQTLDAMKKAAHEIQSDRRRILLGNT